jgi:MFS family permease
MSAEQLSAPARPAPDAAGPSVSAARAWYIVIVLCALYAVSFVDRLILSLLADPVSRDLSLSDLQMGLLLGVGFAAVYTAVGLPISHWVDRSSRMVMILAAGTAFWSVATAASAFANSFTTLLICRTGVAVGEAVLAPIAMSLIADLFPRDRRAGPVAAFSVVTSSMKAGGIVLGAAAIALAGWLYGRGIGLEIWRTTFLILGVPGLLLAAMLAFTIKDPPKRLERGEGRESSTLSEFIRHLKVNRGFYFFFYLGVGTLGMMSYAAVSWIPTILIRGFSMTSASAGFRYGLVALPAAILGSVLWAVLSRRFDRGGGAGPIRGLLVAIGLASPMLALSALADSSTVYLLATLVASFGTSAMSVLGILAIQNAAPRPFLGRLYALQILVTNLIGFALGPLLVAVMSQQWHGDPQSLAKGLSLLAMLAGPVSFLSFYLCMARYRVLADK